MLQTAARKGKRSTAKAAPQKSITRAASHERFLEAFRWMLLARTLEEKLVSLYRGGQITGGVYIGKGQEAVSVACGMSLQKGDVFAPLIRDQAGRSAFGEPLVDVARTYLGSVKGPMRGRDGNIHRGCPRDGQLAMISHLGAMVSVTVGALMAKRWRGEKNFVGLTTIGEGGMQAGAFHEGMNIAAVEQVPLVIGGAVRRARAGRPPQLVVAEVLRLSGHGEHDDASYVTEEIKREPFARDCLKVAEKVIVDLHLIDGETLQSWRDEAAAKVEEAITTAQKEPGPDGGAENWCAISTRELVDPAE
jgi:pyruvate dehydrogenase E1 component alpha subunit/2-oxoisovalerate dehydrogenase E1 component alpha subunit